MIIPFDIFLNLWFNNILNRQNIFSRIKLIRALVRRTNRIVEN